MICPCDDYRHADCLIHNEMSGHRGESRSKRIYGVPWINRLRRRAGGFGEKNQPMSTDDDIELLIANAIAYAEGHMTTLDTHRRQARAVLTALETQGYEIVEAGTKP